MARKRREKERPQAPRPIRRAWSMGMSSNSMSSCIGYPPRLLSAILNEGFDRLIKRALPVLDLLITDERHGVPDQVFLFLRNAPTLTKVEKRVGRRLGRFCGVLGSLWYRSAVHLRVGGLFVRNVELRIPVVLLHRLDVKHLGRAIRLEQRDKHVMVGVHRLHSCYQLTNRHRRLLHP